jgi:hypothetical protein
MSYDLYFRPRTGELTESAFNGYFRDRPHYKIEGAQAWYQNEDTGVYFVFERQDSEPQPDDEGEAFPATLNVNYFRPSYFGLEAQPEVTAFVRAFDMTVSDPQLDGMGDGEYVAERFLTGWNKGNEFGYEAILSDRKNREGLASLPTEKLMQAWHWNRNKLALQLELGESKFVPRIMFLRLDGQVVTIAVWPDGIPIAVPEVDYFFVPRKELAPRRFLRKKQDQTVLAYADALAIFEPHQTRLANGTPVLNYLDAPRDVRAFVEALPLDRRPIEGLSADKVLDQELVEKQLR